MKKTVIHTDSNAIKKERDKVQPIINEFAPCLESAIKLGVKSGDADVTRLKDQVYEALAVKDYPKADAPTLAGLQGLSETYQTFSTIYKEFTESKRIDNVSKIIGIDSDGNVGISQAYLQEITAKHTISLDDEKLKLYRALQDHYKTTKELEAKCIEQGLKAGLGTVYLRLDTPIMNFDGEISPYSFA